MQSLHIWEFSNLCKQSNKTSSDQYYQTQIDQLNHHTNLAESHLQIVS
jgi:hypothetical protein